MSHNAYDLFQQASELLQERKASAAAVLLERAKELEPHKGSILEALGIAYYNSGHHERAMREFEEALEVDPTNHYARYGFSRCLHRKGLLHRAIGEVKLAVVMEPDMELYEEALKRYQRDLARSSERRGFEG